ncbi:hypothetical protein C5S29_08935 [ANME-1 cluster archaeon GoMg3.2]|nr:hypothetical protein [ANME-1 cluster archaeon GoMg3.2]
MKKDVETFIEHILECVELIEQFGVDVGGRYKRHSRFKEEDVKNKGRIDIVKMIEISELKR